MVPQKSRRKSLVVTTASTAATWKLKNRPVYVRARLSLGEFSMAMGAKILVLS